MPTTQELCPEGSLSEAFESYKLTSRQVLPIVRVGMPLFGGTYLRALGMDYVDLNDIYKI